MIQKGKWKKKNRIIIKKAYRRGVTREIVTAQEDLIAKEAIRTMETHEGISKTQKVGGRKTSQVKIITHAARIIVASEHIIAVWWRILKEGSSTSY